MNEEIQVIIGVWAVLIYALLFWLAVVIDRKRALKRLIKSPCPACKGLLVFAANRQGEQSLCPHCNTVIILEGEYKEPANELAGLPFLRKIFSQVTQSSSPETNSDVLSVSYEKLMWTGYGCALFCPFIGLWFAVFFLYKRRLNPAVPIGIISLFAFFLWFGFYLGFFPAFIQGVKSVRH